MLDAARIDHIRRTLYDGPPHLGAETEGIVTDPSTLEIVHTLAGQQPTQAVLAWLRERGGEAGTRAAVAITPDVPETTIEANPEPLRSPRSTASAQRLLAILVDTALQGLAPAAAPQLLHGAAWRPPHITAPDASEAAGLFKQLYYQFQIATHGDKVGAAAGDHLNISAPWLGYQGASEISRKMIEMTARMRLVAGALTIGLTASSPLYFGANGGKAQPTFATALTPLESARLGRVWPGRTIMDVSGLYQGPVPFRRTLQRFADTGTLLSGRDVWLMARAQPGPFEPGPSFEDALAGLGIDLGTPEGRDRARELLFASFARGPSDRDNPLRDAPDWQAIEAWRQAMLRRLIRAPRNRVEIRTLETPPAFAPDSPGGSYRTPYEFNKSVHAFLEVLFIYLAENPELVEDLEYGELELQAAKSNEHAVIHGGLDARIRSIAGHMHSMPARQLLRQLLDAMEPLTTGLGRADDLALVRRIAEGEEHPPAARIRLEVGAFYGINADLRYNTQLLPDDHYPQLLLSRSRQAMDLELRQIETDLPTLPFLDQRYVRDLLALVRQLRAPESAAA